MTAPGDDRAATEEQRRLVPTSPRAAQLALVVIAAVLIGMSIVMLRGGDGRGARGLEPGTSLPQFAAPLVTSSLDGDVNLTRLDGGGAAGSVPACSIRRPDVVTSCALAARGPVVLMFATPSDRCVAELDALDRAARAWGGRVEVAAVAVRGDRDGWRRAASRWSFPLLYDRDGGLAVAFGVEICPQTTIAARGGRVRATIFGAIGEDELVRRVDEALGR